MEDLRQRTLTGLGWTAISQIGTQTVGFAISVVLARLLTPRDFGLVGMITVFTGFANLFTELGFGAALVQRKNAEDRHYSSIFWLNLAAGFVLMILIMATAPWIASFYAEPQLAPLTRLIAAGFFLGAFNIVQRVLLRRSLDFRTLAFVQITAMLVAGVVAITLAFMGYGPFALVWRLLVSTAVSVLALWLLVSWHPRLEFHWSAVKELLGFSSGLLGSNILNYWIRSADNLLIGKFVGSADLGIYSRAYSTMLLPLTQITRVVSRVMFPALSRIQDEKLRVKRIYLRAISTIALITFPMVLGLLVVAEAFVGALYGPQWIAVVPVLRVLCLVGFVQSISATPGWIYQSQGRTDWQFGWVLIAGILTLAAFGIGIQWGVMGVAVAYTIRVYATLYFAFAIPGRLINMTFGDVVRALAGIFGCAVSMALLVWAVGQLLPATLPHWVYLAIQVPVGMGFYLGLIHLFKLPAYRDVRSLAAEQWRLRRGHRVPAKKSVQG